MIVVLPVAASTRRSFTPLLPKRVRPPAEETAPRHGEVALEDDSGPGGVTSPSTVT